jgi:hypothetical protein
VVSLNGRVILGGMMIIASRWRTCRRCRHQRGSRSWSHDENIIDLKTGKLTHQDLGQLQLYVNSTPNPSVSPNISPNCRRCHSCVSACTRPSNTRGKSLRGGKRVKGVNLGVWFHEAPIIRLHAFFLGAGVAQAGHFRTMPRICSIA